jgi:cellulose synthase/poly-beta-1,6-N-acetylglucosamine synthase-like glycosyltransferase
VRKVGVRQSPLMRRFSTLAGQLRSAPRRNVSVRFIDLKRRDYHAYHQLTRILSYGTLILVIGVSIVLLQPAHWVVVQQPNAITHVLNWLMLASLFILQTFLIINTFAAVRATLKAKDPIPLQPASNMRVAFITTRAPGEPASMVCTTLEAAKRIRYRRGVVDVWLLDETNDSILKELCNDLGVKYFSRAGSAQWNTSRQLGFWKRLVTRARVDNVSHNPAFAARSKHGNLNAWREYLEQSSLSYDIIAGVDTDHVPESNYLERLLGYFRDPDVAYVVGPQVYGNYTNSLKGLVARWAESQASFFQGTIQRAGNATTSAMFVGTNYAIRTIVLKQIGGFQAGVTEDMVTGLTIHAHRNIHTGNHWKSIYTPDVVAVGEGPEFWSTYFTQQWRWAAGTFEAWKHTLWRVIFKLSPGALLHYLLMLTFYPITALTWLLGIVSSVVYLFTGATAVLVPWNQFISLSLMSLVMQFSLYFWNRRYNVSPHESEGSYGFSGMALTALTAPIYLSAFMGIMFGKKPHFVVTTKGSNQNPDSLQAFRIHLQWMAILLVSMVFGVFHHHANFAILLWVGVQLLLCLLPVVLGMSVVIR